MTFAGMVRVVSADGRDDVGAAELRAANSADDAARSWAGTLVMAQTSTHGCSKTSG